MNQMISTPVLASVGAEMENWLGGWATKLSPADWAAALDPLASDLICEAVRDVGGTEESLWIADWSQSALVQVFNAGSRAAEFVLKFAQPLSRGIIAMVHANQMPVIEGDVAEASRQDPTLDQRLGVRTTSLLAVPFQFAGCPLGVLLAVMLETPGREKLGNFAPQAIVTFERKAETLRRILEWRFMRIGGDGMPLPSGARCNCYKIVCFWVCERIAYYGSMALENTSAPNSYAEFLEEAATPALIKQPPGPDYAAAHRLFQGIPSVTVTPKGRLWATWYSGGQGECPMNYPRVTTIADPVRLLRKACRRCRGRRILSYPSRLLALAVKRKDLL